MRNDEPLYSVVSSYGVPVDTSGKPGQPFDLDNADIKGLLVHLVRAQQKQNTILEQMLANMTAAARQRTQELAIWKQSNPKIANACYEAAQKLGKIQLELLEMVTDEVEESYDDLLTSEFGMGDFLDRFGPRMIHLNSILQILAPLGSIHGVQTPNF